MSAVMLGVDDLDRAKRFYAEGLGREIDKDTHHFVSFHLGRAPQFALYEWDAAAKDAGVSPEGSGFRGASFHLNPDSRGTVNQTISKGRGRWQRGQGSGSAQWAATSPTPTST